MKQLHSSCASLLVILAALTSTAVQANVTANQLTHNSNNLTLSGLDPARFESNI